MIKCDVSLRVHTHTHTYKDLQYFAAAPGPFRLHQATASLRYSQLFTSEEEPGKCGHLSTIQLDARRKHQLDPPTLFAK